MDSQVRLPWRSYISPDELRARIEQEGADVAQQCRDQGLIDRWASRVGLERNGTIYDLSRIVSIPMRSAYLRSPYQANVPDLAKLNEAERLATTSRGLDGGHQLVIHPFMYSRDCGLPVAVEAIAGVHAGIGSRGQPHFNSDEVAAIHVTGFANALGIEGFEPVRFGQQRGAQPDNPDTPATITEPEKEQLGEPGLQN
jgi:hypothetical protein